MRKNIDIFLKPKTGDTLTFSTGYTIGKIYKGVLFDPRYSSGRKAFKFGDRPLMVLMQLGYPKVLFTGRVMEIYTCRIVLTEKVIQPVFDVNLNTDGQDNEYLNFYREHMGVLFEYEYRKVVDSYIKNYSP